MPPIIRPGQLSESSTRAGAALLALQGAQAAYAPPVDTVQLVIQLLTALVGLWQVIRPERGPRPD